MLQGSKVRWSPDHKSKIVYEGPRIFGAMHTNNSLAFRKYLVIRKFLIVRKDLSQFLFVLILEEDLTQAGTI